MTLLAAGQGGQLTGHAAEAAEHLRKPEWPLRTSAPARVGAHQPRAFSRSTEPAVQKACGPRPTTEPNDSSVRTRSAAGSASVAFPVGNSTYDPVSIRTATGGDVFRIAVQDAPSSEGLGTLTTAIDHVIQQTNLPAGVHVDLRGSVQGMRSSFKSFGLGLILSVILVYLILVAQFASFIDPFIILLAIPPGLAGVGGGDSGTGSAGGQAGDTTVVLRKQIPPVIGSKPDPGNQTAGTQRSDL